MNIIIADFSKFAIVGLNKTIVTGLYRHTHNSSIMKISF